MTSFDLTDQERTALLLDAQGLTLAAAARRLDLSTRHYQRVLDRAAAKLGATSRINAVAIAATARIIAVPPEGN